MTLKMDEACETRWKLAALGLAIYAIVIRFLIWRGSGFGGEDAYITMRYAENLAHGNGFVFNLGERVQGSTTPLGTMLVAMGVRLGLDSMSFSRTLGILADGITTFFIARWLARPAYGAKWAGLFAALLWALDRASHEVAVSGMETPLVTLAGVLGFWAVLERRPTLVAVLGATLLLLRIDTVPLVGTLAMCAALRGVRFSRRDAATLCLPPLAWVLFSWVYFGSPLPNSLRAKLWAYPASWHASLGGFENQFGGSIGKLTILLCVAGALILLAQIARSSAAAVSSTSTFWRDERVVLLAAFVWMLVYYGALILGRRPVFYWYLLPPRPYFWMLVVWPFSFAANFFLKKFFRDFRPVTPLWKNSLAAISLAVMMIAASRWQVHRVVPILAVQQQFQNAVIPPLSQFLQQNVRDDERVMLEPIGYIGYFSRRRVLDLVGLVSPEVGASYRTKTPLADMLTRLQPQWLCLRPSEVAALKQQDPSLPEKFYRLEKTFFTLRNRLICCFTALPKLRHWLR